MKQTDRLSLPNPNQVILPLLPKNWEHPCAYFKVCIVKPSTVRMFCHCSTVQLHVEEFIQVTEQTHPDQTESGEQLAELPLNTKCSLCWLTRRKKFTCASLKLALYWRKYFQSHSLASSVSSKQFFLETCAATWGLLLRTVLQSAALSAGVLLPPSPLSIQFLKSEHHLSPSTEVQQNNYKLRSERLQTDKTTQNVR